MAYAFIDDVSDRLGRAVSDAAEIQQIETWIEDAGRLILRRIPDLATRVAAGTIDRADVVMVEAQAVVRKVKNPDGKQNERIDDYSYGLVKDAARGEVFITDDEWDLLLPIRAPRGSFSVRPAWG